MWHPGRGKATVTEFFITVQCIIEFNRNILEVSLTGFLQNLDLHRTSSKGNTVKWTAQQLVGTYLSTI